MTDVPAPTNPSGQPPLIVRTVIDAPPHRVFAAWTAAEELARWYSPDDGWPIVVRHAQFQVGGRSVVEFGPRGEPPYIETATYQELDPPHRLVFTTDMTRDGQSVSSTRCTIDLTDLGDGRTEVVLTETGYNPAFRDDREAGWARTLHHLATHCAATAAG